MGRTRILLALDGQPTTADAVKWVAGMTEAGEVDRVVLGYVLPPIAPRLLEHGGGDTPEEEREKQGDLDRERAAWIRREQASARALIRPVRDALCRTGLADKDITVEFITVVHDSDVAENLIETARDRGCELIVVSEAAFGWYRERHTCSVAELLQRDIPEGMAVVVRGKDDEGKTFATGT
jgi:nucleotide-binding universal stress UspA family protein